MENLLSNKRFMFIHSFSGGHKLFYDVSHNRIAIADRSGSRPDQTEDGVLWLHPKKVDGQFKFESERSGNLYSTVMGEGEKLVFAMLIGLLESTNPVKAINTLHQLSALHYGIKSEEVIEGDAA